MKSFCGSTTQVLLSPFICSETGSIILQDPLPLPPRTIQYLEHAISELELRKKLFKLITSCPSSCYTAV